ncbi:MAG: hypothetical protein ACNA7E_08970 [Wenzhouxiangellaceae bacterium]
MHAEDLLVQGWRASGLTITLAAEAEFAVEQIAHDDGFEIGSLALQCERGVPLALPPCSGGTLQWLQPPDRMLEFTVRRQAHTWSATREDGRVELAFPGPGQIRLKLHQAALDWLPPGWLQGYTDLTGLAGTVSLEAGFDGEWIELAGALQEVEFDTPDGRYAGAGIGLDIDLGWQPESATLRLESSWRAGELLLGAVYLPSPSVPWRLDLDAIGQGAQWRLQRLVFERVDTLSLTGSGHVDLADDRQLKRLDLELAGLDLSWLWDHGLQSLAATAGWGGLLPAGQARGRLSIKNHAIDELHLVLDQVSLRDDRGRLELDDVQAELIFHGADNDTNDGLDLSASWSGARLLSLPLGGSSFVVRGRDDGSLKLDYPLQVPLLEGRVVVDDLDWRNWRSAERDLRLSARLEPVDLAQLTRALGWTEFGGSLAGRFPALRLRQGVIEFEGGLDVELFSGTARVENFSIERPFGTLPALAADLEFSALDLEQLTGAFEFGYMTGLLSGHLRELRLLDWQPVQFDARFETLIDAPRRRISQQAVDSLSSLSGAGGAMLSGTLLRFFEDFPYRRVGLGCRLRNNVCTMQGLEATEGGGYLILEGRGLPRLNIIGHHRSVNWPRLMAQIQAATGGG